MKNMMLVAPKWLWISYSLLLILLCASGSAGGRVGSFSVAFGAAFSFQFWTYAAWRGQKRIIAELRALADENDEHHDPWVADAYAFAADRLEGGPAMELE